MLKVAFLFVALATSVIANADCDIDESLKNKACSSDYFMAKNSRQLNEYLQYGKFKDGKLLNLEIGFNVKEKEINVGTTCDMRLKYNADLRASLNGICLQARNIFIGKQSNLIADKKAPISLIANDSIKIRRANIQTAGDVNISTKSFNPFSNEILISRNSQVLAGKLNVSTPSSLIINNDSKIKSSSIVLNGGSCEIGGNDDLFSERKKFFCKMNQEHSGKNASRCRNGQIKSQMQIKIKNKVAGAENKKIKKIPNHNRLEHIAFDIFRKN